jgi:hypothetical protein
VGGDNGKHAGARARGRSIPGACRLLCLAVQIRDVRGVLGLDNGKHARARACGRSIPGKFQHVPREGCKGSC